MNERTASGGYAPLAPSFRGTFLILLSMVMFARPVSAKILSTRPPPSETWSPLLSLTIGGGFEFETDSERSRYEFPMLVEYNFTEMIRATIEPTVVYVDSKGTNVNSAAGPGDLDTTLQWEFLRERRYRPALTLEGSLRWPTATHSELGDPGWDYSLGLIASKDFVYIDVDLSLRYTYTSDAATPDDVEITLAGEWPLNHRLSILGEVDTTIETSHGRIDTEGTAGLAWRATSHLKLEGGGTVRSDGTWQLILSWEWNFAGED
jgi:hypothetical protein